MEKYRTLGRRLGAAILDSFVLIPLTWLISAGINFVVYSPTAVAFSSALTGAIPVLYSILMHAIYGQTVGKMAAKVKVLDDSESSINFGQAILRGLPYLIPAMFSISFSNANLSDDYSITTVASLIYGSLTIFYIADIVVCLVSEKRRALHDFIAGTIVVKTDV